MKVFEKLKISVVSVAKCYKLNNSKALNRNTLEIKSVATQQLSVAKN